MLHVNHPRLVNLVVSHVHHIHHIHISTVINEVWLGGGRLVGLLAKTSTSKKKHIYMLLRRRWLRRSEMDRWRLHPPWKFGNQKYFGSWESSDVEGLLVLYEKFTQSDLFSLSPFLQKHEYLMYPRYIQFSCKSKITCQRKKGRD